MKKALATIFGVLILDQWLKIWIKLNFYYGQSETIIPGWLDLQFVENPGMAFGWMIPGDGGKLALSIFRIIVAGFIIVILSRIIRKKAHWGYIISMSLIVAGALGNIIDGAVYGLVFDKGSLYNPDINDYGSYIGKATINQPGYSTFMMGNVVDMFHFTKEITIAGKSREIFPPVFNIADSAISCGIISILLFQRRFFGHSEEEEKSPDSASATEVAGNPGSDTTSVTETT